VCGPVYQRATKGLGVAVGQLHFVTDDLLAGRLVAPFRLLNVQETGCYLVFPQGPALEPLCAGVRRLDP